MNTLCLDIGSKHCGSPELVRAGKYVQKELLELGYDVFLEDFDAKGWEFNSFSLINETTGEAVPDCCACYFSNSADISDVPLWISDKELDRLSELDVSGRLCFIKYWYDTRAGQVFGYNAIAEELDRLGAAAAIFLNRAPHTQLAPSTKIQRSPFLKELATVAIAERGAIYMANHPNDRYHLKVDARVFDTSCFNVVGRIGNGKKKGVIGAHYDTAPLIQGAQDNAGGVAIMLELARLFKSEMTHILDEWTLDFVAFSAEEYVPSRFCPGSYDYVMRHKNDNIKWMLNIDDVAPHFAYPELAVHGLNKLPPISLPYPQRDCTTSDDVGPFHTIGVPTLWIASKKLYGELHTAMDNLSHSDFELMTRVTLEYLELIKQLTETDFWQKERKAPDIKIAPTEPCHYEKIADLAVLAWQGIYEGYRAQLGDELFCAFFEKREEGKRKSVIAEAESCESYVALDGERVCAFINFKCDGKIGELCTNAILPEYQGFGIGARLQAMALTKMKEQGCTHAFVITGGDEGHLPARRSYEKNGFAASLPSVKYFKKL
jgi:Iap family predicted aminopeptidase